MNPLSNDTTVDAPEDGVKVTRVSRLGLPPVEHAYVYGIEDGKKDLGKESFETYIESTVDEEASNHDAIRTALDTARTDLDAAFQLEREIASREVRVKEARTRQERLKTDMDEARQRVMSIDEERGYLKRGSFWMGLLFLIAAVLFIVGEVSVARTIVADGFEMEGSKAWIFAIALAMMSVLIKPAYDRLVEEPYWDGKGRAFRWTILACTTLAVTTILLLAIFRNDAFIVSKEIGSLAQMGASTESILEKMRELGEKWSGRFGLIGAAVTFAIGGGVTLSIGSAHMRDWSRRKTSIKQSTSAREAFDKHDQANAEAEAELAALRTQVSQANIPVLSERVDTLETELTTAIENNTAHRKKRLTSLYENGHEFGETLTEIGEEWGRFIPGSGVDDSKPKKRRKVRPYVALRRHIRNEMLNDTPWITS